jgi:Ca2+-binding RTX toxin-like protein
MRRNGDDLSLSINGTDDVLTMPDWFYQTDYRVEAVAFADGTIWDTVDLTSARFVGTEGVDNLVGSVENDFLEGRGGDDSLMAYDGDDSLDAGPGNDLLAGGMGNDVFRFGRGDGQDTIREPAPQGNLANALARPLGSDTILFKPGVAASDVRLWRDDLNLYIGINGTSDTINVVDWFLSTTRVVECVEFADGTVWGTAELAAAKYAGTEGADTFIGDDRNDVFEGRGGNDTISAGAGDDVLDGGLGNDLLEGGAGNDCYIFAPGYGQDTVVESAGVDVVKLGVGLTAANVQLWRDAANLYIGIVGSSDVLTVQNWFELDANRIESIQFADGTIWGTAVLESAGFAGTEGSDFMMGGSWPMRVMTRWMAEQEATVWTAVLVMIATFSDVATAKTPFRTPMTQQGILTPSC